jgi:hypothetical protein
MTTQEIINDMRSAADRLQELQEKCNMHYETICELTKERNEARAEVERLKADKQTRPEPSRLEIAAMLKAGWFANCDVDFYATDHKWWIEQADALIAAAREAR